MLGLLFMFASAVSMAELTWSGDFNDGNFLNYHSNSNVNEVYEFFVPRYGRSIQYGGQVEPDHVGNGDLLSLQSSITRGGKFAAKFTVKSLAGGGVEPNDCDPAIDCRTRRTTLLMQNQLLDFYNAMPYKKERWLSVSFYLPSDFAVSEEGWMPVVWGSKGSAMTSFPGWAGVLVDNNGWKLVHRYFSEKMWNDGDSPNANWWLAIPYSSTFPDSDSWPQGLVDFPDEKASKAALANLNLGGWTDFVFHFRTDVDTEPFSNNVGFWDAYMRAGTGPWVHVLKIRPMKDVNYGGQSSRLYDRGVGQYGPQGLTSQVGLYMPKERIWNQPHNVEIYVDNYKIGDERTTFEEMTHDGSSPGKAGDAAVRRPAPPEALVAE